MKILHVIFSLSYGGSEVMLVDIINEQVKTEGVNVLIINKDYNNDLIKSINKRAAIHLINRSPGSRNLFSVFYFNYIILKIQPDIIHFHDHNAIALLIYKGKARTCLTIHDVNKPIDHLKKYRCLFSISNAVSLNVFSRSRLQSTRVYNGVNFSKIIFKDNYLMHGTFHLVQVSRLQHEKKGQHLVLEALHQLIYKYGLSNLRVDFIGDGPSLQFLKEHTLKLNLSPYVNFPGSEVRSVVYANLHQYHLLVQPSIYEGFGLTVVEGIAAGVPVLVSNIEGPAEIVNDIVSGWTFESGNVKSLVIGILGIMELYASNEISQICRTGFEQARKKYSIQDTAVNYTENYRKLLSTTMEIV